MKVFSAEALAAMIAGTAIVSGAVSIACSDPVAAWGGHGTLDLSAYGGESAYLGIGDRGLAQTTNAALGGTAQGLTLTLSGIDPDLVGLITDAQLRGARAVFWRLIFDGSGTRMLDAHVFTRGRVDTAPIEDEVGRVSALMLSIEGPARGLGRRGGRMRTDADQRLVEPTDGGMRHVSYAAQKQLYWGGQRPAQAGAALGGINPGVGVNTRFLAQSIVEQ